MHGFIARTGGVSLPPFSSLNFDCRGTDPPENIARNTRLLTAGLSLRSGALSNLFTMNQVHASSVIELTDISGLKKYDADAVITNLGNVPLGILTADCMPVLFYDPANKAIGAAHAGWKGTLEDISVKTLNAMQRRFGSKAEDVLAAFGPYIGPCCYTVGKDLHEKFTAAFGNTANDYFTNKDNSLRLDIGKANFSRLVLNGVRPENIERDAPCTSCETNIFFSYRRENGATGRQLSFIMLLKD